MSINWNEISSLSTFGLLVATIILVLHCKGQMRKISSTSRITFLLELKRDFFTESGREIYSLLQHNLLQFQVQKIENLLTHLEDLGFLYAQGELTIDDATQLFGYFIKFVWEHKEIKQYIEWVRTENTDIYSNFECIYRKVKKLCLSMMPNGTPFAVGGGTLITEVIKPIVNRTRGNVSRKTFSK